MACVFAAINPQQVPSPKMEFKYDQGVYIKLPIKKGFRRVQTASEKYSAFDKSSTGKTWSDYNGQIPGLLDNAVLQNLGEATNLVSVPSPFICMRRQSAGIGGAGSSRSPTHPIFTSRLCNHAILL
uniref:Uncharacterized protein n=1 Tax=Coccidioides posadasii RMSCC 3488 TaxID=454284 RepID=A0A0J6F439_COCPO|nr:hypothetical protein CPAG_03999 [Coccidioides posadasii RMSCC 3488]